MSPEAAAGVFYLKFLWEHFFSDDAARGSDEGTLRSWGRTILSCPSPLLFVCFLFFGVVWFTDSLVH